MDLTFPPEQLNPSEEYKNAFEDFFVPIPFFNSDRENAQIIVNNLERSSSEALAKGNLSVVLGSASDFYEDFNDTANWKNNFFVWEHLQEGHLRDSYQMKIFNFGEEPSVEALEASLVYNQNELNLLNATLEFKFFVDEKKVKENSHKINLMCRKINYNMSFKQLLKASKKIQSKNDFHLVTAIVKKNNFDWVRKYYSCPFEGPVNNIYDQMNQARCRSLESQ